MTDYCIQKPTKDPYLSKRDGGWVPAFGLNAKSYIKASNDEDACKQFDEATKKCRTPYRLIKWSGIGFNPNKTVLKTNGIEEKS